jgi:Fe-S cluster biosynthesis and repair protein YggX
VPAIRPRLPDNLLLRGVDLGALGTICIAVRTDPPEESAMARTVQCVKLGREAEGLDFPPYPGALGKRIYEQVSREAWHGWLEHQKRLINEMRLNLADAKARQYLAQQMEQHFFGGGAEEAQGYVPPART